MALGLKAPCSKEPSLAATVSYTEAAVFSDHAVMRYHAGAPCSVAVIRGGTRRKEIGGRTCGYASSL